VYFKFEPFFPVEGLRRRLHLFIQTGFDVSSSGFGTAPVGTPFRKHNATKWRTMAVRPLLQAGGGIAIM
jgi:hypothetical protein